MTDQREAVIQVKGLKKNFGSLEVLKGVDMKVLKGEAVVVIGRPVPENPHCCAA